MDYLREYWRALAVDRGRIVMVTLGVVWGVSSLSIVWAFGTGFERAMSNATENSGVEILRLWNGTTTRPWRGLAAGSPVLLSDEDARYLEKAIPELRGVSVEYRRSGVPIAYQDQSSNVRLHGVDPIYQSIRRFPVQSGGRFINRTDALERRRVAFLGDAIKERMFGSRSAIGEEIELFGMPFTVVGVLKPKATISNYEGEDKWKVLIPAPTYKTLLGAKWVSYLLLWLPDLENDRRFLRRAYQVLGERRGFDPDDEKALGFSNHVEIYRRIDRIVGSTRVLLLVVTLFGFLVSVVGVANVMYVMVEERRKEWAIQMALGSRPGAVLLGRLGEGMLITVVGGLIGVGGSALVVLAMNGVSLDPEARNYLGYPDLSLGMAFGLAGLLGVAGTLAGYWPARRAAATDPVLVLHDS